MSRWRQIRNRGAAAHRRRLGGDGPGRGFPEPTLHLIPDLRLSISEVPGEVSVRVPLAADSHLLYGLLSPYVSLGSSTSLGVPWATSLPPGLRRDIDGLEDVRLGAGMAVPLSERAQLYGEYRFLRGRLDAGVGARSAPARAGLRGFPGRLLDPARLASRFPLRGRSGSGEEDPLHEPDGPHEGHRQGRGERRAPAPRGSAPPEGDRDGQRDHECLPGLDAQVEPEQRPRQAARAAARGAGAPPRTRGRGRGRTRRRRSSAATTRSRRRIFSSATQMIEAAMSGSTSRPDSVHEPERGECQGQAVGEREGGDDLEEGQRAARLASSRAARKSRWS